MSNSKPNNKLKNLGNKAKTDKTQVVKSKDRDEKPKAASTEKEVSHSPQQRFAVEDDYHEYGDSAKNIVDYQNFPELENDDSIRSFSAVKKPCKINISLIANRCLGKKASDLSPELIMAHLNEVTHVRLDRENIEKIDGLEILGPLVKNLYLQYNCISLIEGLETLTDLRFLILSNNKIRRVENLSYLRKLQVLDLSHNSIDVLDIDQLPTSLYILSLDGNPCQNQTAYKDGILQHCHRLSQLDGVMLTVVERRASGHDVQSESDDSSDESPSSFNKSKPFDADITDIFDDLSTDMFMRCQSRIQQVIEQHKEHVGSLEAIKQASGITTDDLSSPLTSRLSSRLSSSDTSDNSRPATVIS